MIFERLKTMLIKEFTQLMRDPKMRSVIFVVPAIQIFVFGYAVNYDVKHIATAVYDLDNSAMSRELVSRLTQSGYFDMVRQVADREEIRQLIDHGTVKAALQINPGFEAALRGGGPPRCRSSSTAPIPTAPGLSFPMPSRSPVVSATTSGSNSWSRVAA